MMAHQIAAKAAGGRVSVVLFRNPADGSEASGVAYMAVGSSTAADWISPQRFTDQAHADAAAAVLAAFLGVRVGAGQ
ncbi:hypothetical protein [Bradyrhizobium sp. cf659]|uniref:hypothetical protein n=1 Tax=Bradyrhizobium sp. cf659 TaxID=1761771 RepID=UPI0008EA7C79|nr:hypothetical protein [Bradyrhizobium sp. cf659]SFH82514.1 hypothetical protein SAMN04487925_101663 [Bradyrhizobium sp. cf659]